MGNDKAVRPLIEFLQATEMGGREGLNERKKEWESRVDREGRSGVRRLVYLYNKAEKSGRRKGPKAKGRKATEARRSLKKQ